MRRFFFTYITRVLDSIPAFGMFNIVGASPFRNFEAIMATMRGSFTAIIVYYAALWVLPAVGSVLGAKFGGARTPLFFVLRRGIGAQILGTLIFTALLETVASINHSFASLATPLQTLTLLAAGQLVCAIGTTWGG